MGYTVIFVLQQFVIVAQKDSYGSVKYKSPYLASLQICMVDKLHGGSSAASKSIWAPAILYETQSTGVPVYSQ